MASGLYLVLGLVVGVVLTAVLFRLRRPAPPAPPASEVSAETLARARDLVARGRIVHAVKAVRDETGWDLAVTKAFVDTLPRGPRKDDGVGHYGGF